MNDLEIVEPVELVEPEPEPVLLDEVQRAKDYRLRLRMSQVDFARRFGLPLQTYVQWERGRRQPEMPAKVLLSLIVDSPDEVIRIVRRGKRREMSISLSDLAGAAA